MTTTRELYNSLVGKRTDRYSTLGLAYRMIRDARIFACDEVGVLHAFSAEDDPKLAPRFECLAMENLQDRLKKAPADVKKWFASKGVEAVRGR